ncbi:hypothetical protein LNA02_18710 [Levilactobacillus namurensis]|nr:hypothetical protein [Levilactobacillus namurensis]MCW3779430.1 hypothetical protein [Levilactobacillus namurensis]MDT7017695.1 hypothetical protein [Levilactobacillus namurensis]WNN65303.1 hypothetical protein RIN67_11530 [Levilactobacillus namurensis]GEO75173.1 hypothetical protein LNA02_18710 [Levilactobacillus namurensis]HJE44639.1 hypothetical protein [Levilactobacillus namurensis]
MVFDWRYAFHSFWFLLTYMILLSTSVFLDLGQGMALGTIGALMVVDGLFTHNYPYFNRVDREGIAIVASICAFAVLTLAAGGVSTAWSSLVWDLLAFALAALGGTIDGCLARPTQLDPGDTRRALIAEGRLVKNS